MASSVNIEIQISTKFRKFTLEELKKNNMKILGISQDKNRTYIKLEHFPVKIKSLLKTDWEMV